MSPQTSKEFIDSINQQTISDDFNYSYLTLQEGMYSIIRRNSKDPYKSTHVMQVMLGRKIPFVDSDRLLKKICEFLADEEYKAEK
jgi:hypothetical protein